MGVSLTAAPHHSSISLAPSCDHARHAISGIASAALWPSRGANTIATKLCMMLSLTIVLGILDAEPSPASSTPANAWTVAPRDFKMGYALAFLDAHYLLPSVTPPSNNFTHALAICIKEKNITPGQMILELDRYAVSQPELRKKICSTLQLMHSSTSANNEHGLL
jgi:hypothetical protein